MFGVCTCWEFKIKYLQLISRNNVFESYFVYQIENKSFRWCVFKFNWLIRPRCGISFFLWNSSQWYLDERVRAARIILFSFFFSSTRNGFATLFINWWFSYQLSLFVWDVTS